MPVAGCTGIPLYLKKEYIILTNRQTGYYNKKSGDAGEQVAMIQLAMMGVRMLRKIHTGWKIVRWINRQKFTAIVVPHKKVSGDINGVLPPSGRRVLCEVKTFEGKSFTWTRLTDGQHENLLENMQLGGLSLICWITMGECIVMDYSAMLQAGFKKGKGIKINEVDAVVWGGVQ